MQRLIGAFVLTATLASGALAGDGVSCGKDWIAFRPLDPLTPFGTAPGMNEYLVRKSRIVRANAPHRGPTAQHFGWIILEPLKGDARADGTYRVSKEAYRAIRECLIGGP